MKYMEIKTENPNFAQKEIAIQIVCSDSTIERYSDNINNDSTYRKNKKRTPFYL